MTEIIGLSLGSDKIYKNLLQTIERVTVQTAELTRECLVYRVDSGEDHRAASLLNPEYYFRSGPKFSNGRGWTSELKLENYSWFLITCSSLN